MAADEIAISTLCESFGTITLDVSEHLEFRMTNMILRMQDRLDFKVIFMIDLGLPAI
jgi:hypothetical protein